ncbi:PREDICTED: ras-like GTP-binding protein Rho1 isoform X1 [Crocodylus porosus]|uniref:ras-like GTP-binding protein Rho1 isoform X1 n=2 Tax=Crocodylus porosus TaxID=8502 RepID=UPI00093DAF2B|nr:PREDICTED: ras-like GTP-binding protein Rho1 isoform X1 [Crocodylus porosus]
MIMTVSKEWWKLSPKEPLGDNEIQEINIALIYEEGKKSKPEITSWYLLNTESLKLKGFICTRSIFQKMITLRKKLTVVGDVACGKTCLLLTFCQEQFPKYYEPTVFENYVTDIEVEGKPVKLMLLDVAGQRQINVQHIRSLFYQDTDVILMCFSVDNPNSLQNILDIWVPEVKHFCPTTPIVLVATKKELRNDENVQKRLAMMGQEPIRSAEGKALAASIGAYAYVECSAKTKEGVERLLEVIGQAAIQDGAQPTRTQCTSCEVL